MLTTGYPMVWTDSKDDTNYKDLFKKKNSKELTTRVLN